ncbi:MAG: PAS domain S-box protein [Gammaproteobacteria bacterium]|nr:MAG: PAS domain S-box protein [Gammaproteobacteria bacterium]
MFESNIDALMTTDTLGIITDVNRQMCAVTGRVSDELIGTPFKDYCTDSKRAEDGIRNVLAEGRVTNYELVIRAKDGKELAVSYNATTFTGEDGKLNGVFAAARDITDQKRLEEQLRQAQSYNRGLIESSVDAMLTVAPDYTITDVNEQMVRLSGYSRGQLIGSSFKEYFSEPERAASGVKKTLDEGYVTNYELSLRSRHRRQILVSFNASVFKDDDGNVRGIFAVARDVTEQRRLEEKLRESENYNRGLIESSVDALVTVNPDLTITDVNNQMVLLTGYPREELVGTPFKDYFTEPEHAAAGVRQTLDEGTVTNYELVLKSLSGKRTVVSFNAGTFKDTAGRIAGILAAARDITAQKKLEEQLRDQQNYNRSLIESSVDALMTVDPNGIIADVNEQTVKLSGYNRKQLIGSPFVDYFTDPELASSGVKKTFDAGQVTNYELVVKSKSGRRVPVSFNAAVFRETSGEVGGILAAAREITHQKRIEQELRDQQTYTRGLIESNIDALITTDPIGIITDVNAQMCEITGCERAELIGTAFKQYFADPKAAEDGIRRVLGEGRVTNYELTIRSKSGRETVVSYNATTFVGADGKPEAPRRSDHPAQQGADRGNHVRQQHPRILDRVFDHRDGPRRQHPGVEPGRAAHLRLRGRGDGWQGERAHAARARGHRARAQHRRALRGAEDRQVRGRVPAPAQGRAALHRAGRHYLAPRRPEKAGRLRADLQGRHRAEGAGRAAQAQERRA